MKINGNLYYYPEKSGLEIFESVDTAGDYEFDMFVVWRKLDDNTLFYGTDSGCSWPTPFEDFTLDENVNKITIETFQNFDDSLKNHSRITKSDYNKVINKVKDFLKIN